MIESVVSFVKQIVLKPEIVMYPSISNFVQDISLGAGDLILTNEYIYQPYFEKLKLPVSILYQENYGTGEPNDVMVDAILSDAEKTSYNRIIAIGGGTIIDIAKILAVSEQNKRVDWLFDHMASLEKKRELMIVPTTCGTGSEVTNSSIINRTHMGTKMGLVSDQMYADIAVLLPPLLESLPFHAFATSSIDALVHAVESSLSPKATRYSKLFSYQSIELILRGYQTIVATGLDARFDLLEDFLVASNFAGIAFATAGCAAVHALSYPLGGTYHVAHGESNYAIFTGVLKEYLLHKQDGEIAKMNRFLASLLNCETDVVYDTLEALLNQILPKKPLHEYGVTKENLQNFTNNVMETQGRLMANNFVPLDAECVYHIYQALY